MKNISKKLFLFWMFLFFPMTALAVDEIDVEYPVGTNISGDEIFDEENIYPGWEKSKTIRVENQSETDGTNLYFTFDVDGDKKLAEKLKLYVIRMTDDSYRIGGEGDRWTLEEADEENLYVDKLSASESERYKIRFDKDAGNEYQNLETDFDIDFRIESDEAGSETEEEILAGQGRSGFTGNPPEEEVKGEESKQESQEEIAGEEKIEVNGKCQGWPMWVWVAILAVFAGFFGADAKRNYDKNEYGWKRAAAFLVLAVAFWYFFDKCREYKWFLYGSFAVAGVIHFLFLYFLRKKPTGYKFTENKNKND